MFHVYSFVKFLPKETFVYLLYVHVTSSDSDDYLTYLTLKEDYTEIDVQIQVNIMPNSVCTKHTFLSLFLIDNDEVIFSLF